jgi:UDP-glucose 4-epimerase
MPTIVVTGGAGFIGSHIAEECAKEGHSVLIIDDLDDYYPPETKRRNLKAVLRIGDVRFVHGDVTNLEFLKTILRKDVEYVFHEAAYPGVQSSIRNPLKSTQVNVFGTLCVLQASLETNVKRVINASSSSVYGDVKCLPMKETESAHPISPYGASKLSAEHYCRLFYELHGLPTVSLRYFTVYGPRMRPDLAIAVFFRKALGNEEIAIFGDGRRTRDFTNIEDVVTANMRLLQTSEADGKAINIGSGKGISVESLATSIKEIARSNSEIKHYGSQKGDIEHTLADTSLAKELLEYEARIDIERGLRGYMEWLEAKRCANGFGVREQRC